jgi:hypothetical protein
LRAHDVGSVTIDPAPFVCTVRAIIAVTVGRTIFLFLVVTNLASVLLVFQPASISDVPLAKLTLRAVGLSLLWRIAAAFCGACFAVVVAIVWKALDRPVWPQRKNPKK